MDGAFAAESGGVPDDAHPALLHGVAGGVFIAGEQSPGDSQEGRLVSRGEEPEGVAVARREATEQFRITIRRLVFHIAFQCEVRLAARRCGF